MLQDFDARTVAPQQGVQNHPVGMFDFQITHTYLKDNQAGNGAMLVVELTSPAGKIEKRYNVVNPSPQAVEIAQKELSALCHAVGIFNVAYPRKPDGSPIYEQAGNTLRGGRGRMEVAPQKRKNEKGELVETGYVEAVKIFDVNGNEPGKSGGSSPSVQQENWGNQSQQPQPQQSNQGGWGANAQQPQQQNNNWGNQQQPQQTQPQQQPQQGGGWSGGGNNAANAGGPPPWAK